MYRKIPPERPYLLDASAWWGGRMGESYLPHSVLHEKVLTLRKLFVHLVHRPKVKSQESYRPGKTQGLCDPWSGGWALLRTFPTGSSTRLQCKYGIKDCDRVIIVTRIQSITSLTRNQGGADGRGGALWRDFTVRVPVVADLVHNGMGQPCLISSPGLILRAHRQVEGTHCLENSDSTNQPVSGLWIPVGTCSQEGTLSSTL